MTYPLDRQLALFSGNLVGKGGRRGGEHCCTWNHPPFFKANERAIVGPFREEKEEKYVGAPQFKPEVGRSTTHSRAKLRKKERGRGGSTIYPDALSYACRSEVLLQCISPSRRSQQRKRGGEGGGKKKENRRRENIGARLLLRVLRCRLDVSNAISKAFGVAAFRKERRRGERGPT